jgi:transcriptional regulator with XRE-family HTH domain
MEDTTNWQRLAIAIKRRRNELGLTQVDLAAAAKVSHGSIKNLESGEGFNRHPPSLAPVEEALGWAAGSAYAIMRGEEPRPLRRQPATADGPPTDPLPASDTAIVDRLPESAVTALSSGRLVDAVVYKSGGATMVTVVLRDPSQPDSSEDAERLQETMAEWTRYQIAHEGRSKGRPEK